MEGGRGWGNEREGGVERGGEAEKKGKEGGERGKKEVGEVWGMEEREKGKKKIIIIIKIKNLVSCHQIVQFSPNFFAVRL